MIQPKRPYLAHVEYWVYLPETKLPPQDILLGRLLRSSPFRVGEEPAVGPQEALLFSDIRLHTALCLRSKNPHLFRPDLFSDHVEPSEDSLRSLSSAQAIAKLRFVSEEPLQGRRHLRFLPHLAEAVAYYGKAETLFDVQAERLAGLESFRAQLDCDPEAEGMDSTRGRRGAKKKPEAEQLRGDCGRSASPKSRLRCAIGRSGPS